MVKQTPANTSAEEQAMRAVIDPWARARWGDDPRTIHELQLGDRRIDMIWVYPGDIIGAEIKGPRDRLGDGRLIEQMEVFQRYIPEVWLFVHERWAAHKEVNRAGYSANVAIYREGGKIDIPKALLDRRKAKRDELCCSRLLERLWTTEVYTIAKRMMIPHEYMPGHKIPTGQVRGALARMLTGQEIVREVCAELRSRFLVGMGSDHAFDRGQATADPLPVVAGGLTS